MNLCNTFFDGDEIQAAVGGKEVETIEMNEEEKKEQQMFSFIPDLLDNFLSIFFSLSVADGVLNAWLVR